MIKIAVVGDIGSGKSYLAKQFGFPVFDADGMNPPPIRLERQ